MIDNTTHAATRTRRPRPLSVQERMTLKGWTGPLACAADVADQAPEAIPAGTTQQDEGVHTAAPVEAESVEVVERGYADHLAVVAVEAGGSGPLGITPDASTRAERPVERRVDRHRMERRGLGDLVSGEGELFSLVVKRRDMALVGCCTAVGLLAGYLIF